MSVKKVADFFKNKVTIELKTGHRFQGLLSHVDYEKNVVVLIDIQNLDHAYDKQQIPHDMKIAEKAFQSESIQEILFTYSHFCQPKKYKKDDFFDCITEEQKGPKQRSEKNYYQNYQGGRGRGGYKPQQRQNKYDKYERNERNDKYDKLRSKKQYEEKDKSKKIVEDDDDDRDYR